MDTNQHLVQRSPGHTETPARENATLSQVLSSTPSTLMDVGESPITPFLQLARHILACQCFAVARDMQAVLASAHLNVQVG